VSEISQPSEREGGHYETEVVYEVVEGPSRRRVLAAILIVLILLLIAATMFVATLARPAGTPQGVAEDGMRWVRSIYGWGQTSAELLTGPVDVAVAPDGTIWTVSGKATLVGFDPDGGLHDLVPFERGEADGQVVSIEGIDVDEDGNIYLCDFGRNMVHIVSPEGVMELSIGIQAPTEIAVRGDRMAVASAFGIAVVTTDGELVAQWATRGNAADQVDIPHGIIWVDDDTILVSDTHNRRLKAYSADGRLLYITPAAMENAPQAGVQSGTEQSEDSTMTPYQLPAGMTLDAAGRAVLVDAFNFSIVAVGTGDGEILDTWGEFGATDGTFAYPTGIDYDGARDYYVVADTANNRIQIVELPDSGGSPLARQRRLLDGPVWLCSIPLLLLVLAVVIAASKRVRKRAKREVLADAPLASQGE
jgi:DNA-binding beta-propeller fold protein YncE